MYIFIFMYMYTHTMTTVLMFEYVCQSSAVDWWTFGILVYEMAYGCVCVYMYVCGCGCMRVCE